MWQLKNIHKFEDIGQRDLVISMCLALVSMYMYKCEIRLYDQPYVKGR